MTLYIVHALNRFIGKPGDVSAILNAPNDTSLDVILEPVARADEAFFVINENVTLDRVAVPVIKMPDARELACVVLIRTNRLIQNSIHDPALSNRHE
ncbi:hypothetical protein D3C74_240270 [compost metagenome]